jgi:hypothetical protein
LASDHANIKFDFYFPAPGPEEGMVPLKAEPSTKSAEPDTKVYPQHLPDSMALAAR